MVHPCGIGYRPPRPIKIKKPYVMAVSGPVIVDIEITDVGVEVVRGSSNLLG